jgi:hypothetical protein
VGVTTHPTVLYHIVVSLSRPHAHLLLSIEAERRASGAAGSGSGADAVRRHLHALDTYGGPLLGIPPWEAGAGTNTLKSGGDLRRFSTKPHQVSGGIDLHARPMSRCRLNQDGAIVRPRQMQAAPDPFLKASAPYQAARVVGVEGRFPWSWLADLGAREGSPCVLGHALSMNASHGGQAHNASLAARKIAVRLRGGLRPQASVDPAERRASRDRLRRRRHFLRHRAECLTHVQHTTRPDHLPESGSTMASQATRDGGAARVPHPAGHQRLAGDRALMGHDDHLHRAVARAVRNTATPHHAHPLSLLRPVPGSGELLRLVLLDAIQHIARVPRGPAGVSSGRLVTWAQAAAGQRDGTAGTKSGNASLTWAFAAAAVRCRRNHPAGPSSRAR